MYYNIISKNVQKNKTLNYLQNYIAYYQLPIIAVVGV